MDSDTGGGWHWSFFTVAICATCRSDLVWSSEISAWRELAALQPGSWKEYLCCPYCDVEDLIVPELEIARAQAQAQQDIDTSAGNFFPSISSAVLGSNSNTNSVKFTTSPRNDSERDESVVHQPRPRVLISPSTSGMSDKADDESERPLSRASSSSASAHFLSNFVLETPSTSAATEFAVAAAGAPTSSSDPSFSSSSSSSGIHPPLTSVLAGGSGPVKRKSFSKVSFSTESHSNDS